MLQAVIGGLIAGIPMFFAGRCLVLRDEKRRNELRDEKRRK